MSEERTYTVEDMTRDHCRGAGTGEVLGVPGVVRVDVDIASGRVTVPGEGLEDDAVGAAVDEAGYRVVRVTGARPSTSGAPIAALPTGAIRGSGSGAPTRDVEP